MNTADRWIRIKRIFQAASERTGAEREAFLSVECADDPALRQEIDELLQSDERAEMFLELPAPEGLLAELSADPVGQAIGVYEVVREIGRGGMGSVYLAVRADDEYHKQVAIKVIKRGMDSREIIERFRRERQTLAGLVHPNIAPLLDGGTTRDGLPFFVMDYVDGLPIDEYCDRHRLSTQARLELFRQVCAGVQYAHQNLVVHRDLKPDNILVTADGVPKLVDFGIAKVLTADGSSQALTSLQNERRPMTLAYASPEQVSGGTITTATDVYSLGVLLYELLTGHHPYRLPRQRHEDFVHAIQTQEPEKPSAAVTRSEVPSRGTASAMTPEQLSETRGTSPEKLRRRLSGDVDTIVLKALRKEPARRYGSVAEFSEDVRRYLGGLPVIARKDTWGYRSQKFIARHRTGVAAAALVLLTLVGGLIAVAWQAQVARREARKAERINDFMQRLLSSANPGLQGQDRSVRQLLDEASQRVEGELAAEPEVRGAVQRTIADAYLALGRYQDAEALLKSALDTDRRLVGDDHERVYRPLARLGFVSYHRGDFTGAERQLRQALDGLRRTLGADHETVADALNWLGLALNEQGKTAEAERYWKQALDLRERLVDPSGGIGKASVVNNLAISRYNQGDLDQAEPLYRQAIAIQRGLPGPPRAELATALQNLGVVYRMKKRYAEAEGAFREALELRLKLLGKDHPYVAIARAHLAEVLTRTGDTAAAEVEVLAALDIQRRTLPDGHVDLARSLAVLGFAKTRAGRPVEGEPHLRQALAIRTKVLPKNHWLISSIGSTLGECLTAQGRYEEAKAELQSARTVLESALGKTHPVTIENQERLAVLDRVWHR